VAGQAWLDHEWSGEILAAEAVGWDWLGIDLDSGAKLMLFQIRDKQSGKLWAGATLREATGRKRPISSESVTFQPLGRWRSPRTGAEYPVGMRVRAGAVELDLQPLMDDQELDSRAITGAIYWEGAVTAVQDGSPVGRGYLELTGYHRPLSF